ncbi:MAG TPA: hypothetical protein VD763_00850 [Candidatus Saccharimonadales bacterium]|nr:hypothetical protein [Candidatus Saccharimonadales bacterium]
MASRAAAYVGGAGPGHASGAASAASTATDQAVQLATRATYRHLILKGMAPDEAANLTAFMCGIPVADVHWSLRQVNQLLFLRELARTGRFGPGDGDGGPPRPH